ncbi:MAG TPA: hypothetical protein PK676_00955 [Bacteroidales bacterium]|nr:hypothetical protein [Bacteroidales bacterium]HQB55653.1 hypothetical protein [Bacteroidales bacterium]
MKTMNYDPSMSGFVLLGDTACCAITGGMSDFDADLAYKFGEILGQAFRALYDLGCSLFGKLIKKPAPANA